MNFELNAVRFAYRSKAYGRREVFAALTLSVASGECVAIVGEEGTGKSTLLQLMDGLLRPDEGTVCVDGKDIWQAPKRLAAVRRRIGFAFQFPETQFFSETIRDELAFASRNFGTGIPSDEQMSKALAELGLAGLDLTRSPFTLSMGEARRVALASILLHNPEALLFDEPTAGLDASGCECVASLLVRLRDERKTLVIATHDDDLIALVADRTIHLPAEAPVSKSPPFQPAMPHPGRHRK